MKTLLALLGSLAAVLLLATPAAAHGGPGAIEVTSITRSGDDVTVTVHLIFTGDGDGVPDATVTVVVGDGLPVTMEPGAEEGDYRATVPAAEGDAIRVTSVEPATSVEATAPAAEDPPATAETPSSDAPTTTAEPTTTAAPDDDDEAATVPTPVPDDGDSDDGGTSPVVIGAIVAVVLAAIVTAVILLGKKGPTDGTDAGTGPGTGSDA